MDIKFFSGDKEIIMPEFDFRLDKENNILILGIKNFNIEEQEILLKELVILKDEKLIINSKYIALIFKNIIYFFDINSYSNFKFEELIVSGIHSFMFAFINENDIIINKTYAIMKLNGHPDNKY